MTQAIGWVIFCFHTLLINQVHVFESLVLPPHYRLMKSIFCQFWNLFFCSLQNMDVPHPSFSLASLTNSNLSDLEGACNSCKNWSANVFTLEQVTTFEEIRPL